MQIFKDDNSPLSFPTDTVIVQPIKDWQFEVKINGVTAGLIITRGEDWGIEVKGHEFNKKDEIFLINIAKSLSAKDKTPKEASQLFHNIIKASVSPKATGSKPVVKPKEEKK